MKGGSPYMTYGGGEKWDCSMQQVIIILACMYFLYYFVFKTTEYFKTNNDSAYAPAYRSSGSQPDTTPGAKGRSKYWNNVVNKLASSTSSV